MDEGYIKFNCSWTQSKPDFSCQLAVINKWRDKLYSLGLIGAYESGVGFGNISLRYETDSFIITGSATGKLKELDEKHYALVTSYDFKKNSVSCEGLTKASSESMTHAALYDFSESIGAVIHVHNLPLWEKLKDAVPTTMKDIPYGTPKMAFEIKRLCKEHGFFQSGIIVMGGHKEGIISFGKDLDEAGEIILDYYKKHCCYI